MTSGTRLEALLTLFPVHSDKYASAEMEDTDFSWSHSIQVSARKHNVDDEQRRINMCDMYKCGAGRDYVHGRFTAKMLILLRQRKSPTK